MLPSDRKTRKLLQRKIADSTEKFQALWKQVQQAAQADEIDRREEAHKASQQVARELDWSIGHLERVQSRIVLKKAQRLALDIPKRPDWWANDTAGGIPIGANRLVFMTPTLSY